MRNKTMKKEMIVLGFFFIIYLISTLFKSDFWGNLLSPIVGGITIFIILKSVFLKKDSKRAKVFWILLSLSVFNWFIIDIIWAVYEMIFHTSAETNLLILNLYNLTNLFLAINISLYCIFKIKKWNMIQLALDVISITLCSLFSFYIVFLNYKLTNLVVLLEDPIAFLTIIIDLVIFILLALWYLSIRKGKFTSWILILSAAFFLYVLTDFVFYYLYIFDLYVPNSLIDAVYMASFVLIAIGTSVRRNWGDGIFLTLHSENTNIGNMKNKSYILLAFPMLIIILKGFIVYDFILFLLIYFLHLCFSFCVQLAIKNDELLKCEKEISITLEKEIVKRTKELVDKNNELNILANQDSVTSLYNRRYLHRAVNEKIKKEKLKESNLEIKDLTEKEATKEATKDNIIFLLMNLDRYRLINAMYGHLIGDQILIEIGNRLNSFSNKNVIIAKLSGDEFGVAVFDKRDYKYAEFMAKDIITHCGGIIKIDQYEFSISMCIGISIFPLDAPDYSSLLKHADAARRQARLNGYNKYISFDDELNKIVNHKNFIELALKNANFDNEFELYYQPQFRIPDKKLIGMEALLRFKTPEGKYISPAEFIPIAEENGYIIPIGDWVMKQAIKKIAEWNKKYSLDLTMGINFSIIQLYNENLIANLQNEMILNGVKPEWLDIELTESIDMESEDKIIKIVKHIKSLGVSISIDDFGTGYSSLSYLKYLPLDRIKIAKELIDTIDKGSYDLHIVKAVHTLTQSVGIKMIAEGVETQDQFDILVDIGCDEIQGYLLSKPLPAELFEQLITAIQEEGQL